MRHSTIEKLEELLYDYTPPEGENTTRTDYEIGPYFDKVWIDVEVTLDQYNSLDDQE